EYSRQGSASTASPTHKGRPARVGGMASWIGPFRAAIDMLASSSVESSNEPLRDRHAIPFSNDGHRCLGVVKNGFESSSLVFVHVLESANPFNPRSPENLLPVVLPQGDDGTVRLGRISAARGRGPARARRSGRCPGTTSAH